MLLHHPPLQQHSLTTHHDHGRGRRVALVVVMAVLMTAAVFVATATNNNDGVVAAAATSNTVAAVVSVGRPNAESRGFAPLGLDTHNVVAMAEETPISSSADTTTTTISSSSPPRLTLFLVHELFHYSGRRDHHWSSEQRWHRLKRFCPPPLSAGENVGNISKTLFEGAVQIIEIPVVEAEMSVDIEVLMCSLLRWKTKERQQQQENEDEQTQKRSGGGKDRRRLSLGVLFVSQSRRRRRDDGLTLDMTTTALLPKDVRFALQELVRQQRPEDPSADATEQQHLRLLVGHSIERSTAEKSCAVRRRGEGHVVLHPFRVVEPFVTFPFFISEDLIDFVLNYYAEDVLHALNEIRQAVDDSSKAAEHKTTNKIEEAVIRILRHSAPPVVSACGLPLSRLFSISPELLIRVTQWLGSPLSFSECVSMFFSGRDVHKLSWAQLNKVLQQEPEHDAAAEFLTIFAAPRQVPFMWLANHHLSLGVSSTSEAGGGGGAAARGAGLSTGVSLRCHSGEDDSDKAILSSAVVRVPAQCVSLRASRDIMTETHVDGASALAVVYVPCRIDQQKMREMTRCFHRSLLPSQQKQIPLHFLLGARGTMDSRFVFAANRNSGGGGPSLSVWHRLQAENASVTTTAAAAGNGDLLLLDVIDLDRAPYTAHADYLDGVTRATETLLRPLLGAKRQWHHISEVSAMLLKLLIAQVHMITFYPSSQYFIRGADDAYHAYHTILSDLTDRSRVLWPSRTSSSSSTSSVTPPRGNRRGHHRQGEKRIFAGHVIMNSIGMRCGKCELSNESVIFQSRLDVEDANRSSSSRSRRRSSRIVSMSRLCAAPALYPFYVSGGGSVLSRDVVHFLAWSLVDVPPLLWIEEDAQLGRLTAPFVLPVKDTRFHNFFNATRDVDFALRGKVPRAYRYCSRNSWVVHKYPWEALQRVSRSSGKLYCTDSDFQGQDMHQCFSILNRTFGGDWKSLWQLGNPKYYMNTTVSTRTMHKVRRRSEDEHSDAPPTVCREGSVKPLLDFIEGHFCSDRD